MAEQVMATRNETLHLQGELDRLSQDLAQSMVLNRVLVKLLLSEGLCSPERLEQLLGETLSESELELAENETPSRFCEDCGRPLSHPGRSCPYCSELSFEVASSQEAESSEAEEEPESSKTPATNKDKSSGTGKKKKKKQSRKSPGD